MCEDEVQRRAEIAWTEITELMEFWALDECQLKAAIERGEDVGMFEHDRLIVLAWWSEHGLGALWK